MNVVKIVQHLSPGCQFSMNGEDPTSAEEYAQRIVWIAPEDAQPSWNAVVAAWPTVSKVIKNEQARQQRLIAFRDEADPLFFGWQRGENTEQAWLDKCVEIRQRFPYVTV